jgi:hypothetical protein
MRVSNSNNNMNDAAYTLILIHRAGAVGPLDDKYPSPPVLTIKSASGKNNADVTKPIDSRALEQKTPKIRKLSEQFSFLMPSLFSSQKKKDRKSGISDARKAFSGSLGKYPTKNEKTIARIEPIIIEKTKLITEPRPPREFSSFNAKFSAPKNRDVEAFSSVRPTTTKEIAATTIDSRNVPPITMIRLWAIEFIR